MLGMCLLSASIVSGPPRPLATSMRARPFWAGSSVTEPISRASRCFSQLTTFIGEYLKNCRYIVKNAGSLCRSANQQPGLLLRVGHASG